MVTENNLKSKLKLNKAKSEETTGDKAKSDVKPYIFTVEISFLIVIIVEILSRASIIGCFKFICMYPLRFLSNVFIVMTTLSVSHFFKKRDWVVMLVSTLWILLGIVDFILLRFRVTPLGMIDFLLIKACLGVINVYFDWWQLVLIGLAVILIIAFVVYMFIRIPRNTVSFKNAVTFLSIAILLMLLSYANAADAKTIQESFSNIAGAYDDFGFVYCFSTSAIDRGIDQPDGYSERNIKKIIRKLNTADRSSEAAIKPNIITVQLESFFDVKYLKDTSFEEDPIPTFTYLKDNFTSGFLTVPSVGAGTANTEFEVVSGMSLDFFGMGEYPYKTILQEEPCESMCTILKNMGYRCGAIHNNTGTFYDRNYVYSQLGFDTFDSIEYMQDVEYNPIGWAKDMCLVNEIEKTLNADEGADFVFTISVQGHGKYQRGAGEENVGGIDTTVFDDDDLEAAFEYYVSQISEMDDFMSALVDMLTERGEPTVLVLYGDHLPNFDIGAEELENGDIFQTEYVIWDNIGLSQEDEDLSSFQLSSKIFGLLGMNDGILTKLHQSRYEMSEDEYISDLEMLEYDMLYGSYFCYGGENPYTPTDIQMGSVPITISDVEWRDGEMYVYGDGFTQWSEILLDGDRLDTELLDYNTLRAAVKSWEGEPVAVQQRSTNTVVLSVTDDYVQN